MMELVEQPLQDQRPPPDSGKAPASVVPIPMYAARDISLDVSRGLIIALMALDHVRIFFSAAQFDPVDLDQTTAGYFLTRWVTHLCAPGFFFIVGLGAWLIGRKHGRLKLAGFLALRGLWLVVLEFALFGFAWSFHPGWTWFGVIWGLGAGMILLSVLLLVPRPALLAGAALFILLHNAFSIPSGGALAQILYTGGWAQLPLFGGEVILYPILPWAALMMLGYAIGPWLMPAGQSAAKPLAFAGAIALLLFVLVRLAGYGQSPGGGFEGQPDLGWTILSFLNVQKYPPSLQFALVTLGLLLLFQAWTAGRQAVTGPLSLLATYGRVPFFFYAFHLFLIHGAALLVAWLLGWPISYLFWTGEGPNLVPPEGFGFVLVGVWLTWLAVLVVLYPACRWFGKVKSGSGHIWLRFL
ncbi:heparan-alpha-glucosaminide N-acetyltransferase domain-containing protein [Sphingosinicella sp. LHD-64]|uniref:DUF1624 domain-containing protein n=1 Tax=Sphingosinicella sp. LHD-64 TaxID=3072139 RepID=UPI0028106B22|nr:heparan-alpha-glucosaminide N-acetyltransferase domain-containing protein [Sphingosinicella sp. LHD-64]MDQ8756214.1 heparan-alpha-glucosaminide N-acetyltransferase domain-containing protein [Sphingosinicella sp. LHD-64]